MGRRHDELRRPVLTVQAALALVEELGPFLELMELMELMELLELAEMPPEEMGSA
jgi:hypothetical protein